MNANIIYGISGLLLIAAIILMWKPISFGVGHGVASVYRIAGITFAETRRRRILQVIILLSALMLIAMLGVTHYSPGEAQKAIITGGLNLVSMLGMLVAIFICAFLIPTDIDKRTIYSVLSKPVKRWEFVVGKYFGALAVIGLLVAVMLIVQMIVLLVTQQYLDAQVLVAGILTYFGIAVFAAVVMAVSTVASSLTTVIAGFVIWMVGNLQTMSHSVISHAEGSSRVILTALSAVVPHLNKYNIQVEVAEKLGINYAAVNGAILYGLGYVAVCLIIASLLFNERQV